MELQYLQDLSHLWGRWSKLSNATISSCFKEKKNIFAVKDVSARAIQVLLDALWQDVSKGIQHPRMIPTPEKDKQIHLPGCMTGKHHKRTWKTRSHPEQSLMTMWSWLFTAYLKHLQDLKTRSLLPVLDYTTTTPDCFHITLQLNGFSITHVRFAATPAVQLSLQ